MKARPCLPGFAFSLILAASVSASESANYSLSPQTEDSGGRRSTSANYTIDSSAAPGNATSSAAYIARSGFAGSLYDLTGLNLTASPLTVTEGGTRQLGASLLLDDATTLSLTPASVAWSVQSGPLTGVSSGGLATAGIVYQNANAVAQGIHSGLTGTATLSVLNTVIDNFGTYAGDSIADDWQVLYFGLNNANAAPLLDPDNDGWINLFEYRAGIVPTDFRSVFNFRTEPVPGQPNQRRIIFSPRLPGHTYTVSSSLTMAPGTWTPVAGPTVSDNGDERTVTDPNASGPRKYYRVDVQVP
jgi:hypothetical protein